MDNISILSNKISTALEFIAQKLDMRGLNYFTTTSKDRAFYTFPLHMLHLSLPDIFLPADLWLAFYNNYSHPVCESVCR